MAGLKKLQGPGRRRKRPVTPRMLLRLKQHPSRRGPPPNRRRHAVRRDPPLILLPPAGVGIP
eukprot:9254441-Pyramimonas_sp.AAC.1